MSDVGWLFARLGREPEREAMVWRDRSFTYRELLTRVSEAGAFLERSGVAAGEPILIDADFSPGAVGMLLAALQIGAIAVPVAADVPRLDRRTYAAIAEAKLRIVVEDSDVWRAEPAGHPTRHALLLELGRRGAPGLVLFSSGSSGEPKAAVHDVTQLLEKFRTERHRQRIVSFLLFDHIGGINTLFYALSNLGCVVTVADRSAATVCAAIEKHRAQVLPASPTFLNLLLLSGEHLRHDLSSLEVISYATEVMPETTLRRLHEAFPGVELRQNYGLSEVGILRSRSRSSDSVWLRIGGEGYETRVVDGILHIRARSSMLGYLNAESPIDAEGWFDTQDEVEVEGEWFRIKGRRSEIVNVGGRKVYPAEVESVILELPNVADVTVLGEPHVILGQVVIARLRTREPEDVRALTDRVRRHCFERLPSYKVPVRVEIEERSQVSERFKKLRRDTGPAS